MKPYYSEAGIEIYCGDCRDVLPQIADGSVDLILTDPPYSEQVHNGARTENYLNPKTLITFAPISAEEIRDIWAALGQKALKWSVAFMAWEHIAEQFKNPPEGWRFVRFGVWVKPNGTPQFTGDRPATGWEAVCIMHKLGGRMAWNDEQHMPGRRLRAIKYKICEGRKSEPKAYPKHRKRHMLTRAERQQMMLDLYAKYVPRPMRAIS
jgi:site-specific DNA-methyltransferase (adenine-specific)